MTALKLHHLFKKHWILFSLFIGLGLLASAYAYFKQVPSLYNTVEAQRMNLVQEISVTGRIKPAQSVNLGFEKGGRVAGAYVKVGDIVSAGKVLIQLENGDLTAQLAQAQASLKSQQATLEDLRSGTRPEEIQVQEVKVQNAKVSLEDAKKSVIDKINDAYTKSDDAVRSKLDQIFSNPRSSNPQISFATGDSNLKTDIETRRRAVEMVFSNWLIALGQLNITSDLHSLTTIADTNLEQVKTLLDKSALLVSGLTANGSLSQTTIDGYKTDIFTGRTNVNTAITNLSTAEEKLRSAEATLLLEQNQLTLKKAGTAPDQVAAQEAKVEEATANVQNAQAQLGKTIIRSPIHGVVTKQDAKVGEIASANSMLVSVISTGQFEVEGNVPEADIAKIQIRDVARITLDAYGSDVVFPAKVTKIDPAETIVDGVSTYKVTFQFDTEDERIKSGMTANIDITTDTRTNVITIPQRAVSGKGDSRTVKILNTIAGIESTQDVLVTLGLRGSDGNVEVISGLREGDRIVVSTK